MGLVGIPVYQLQQSVNEIIYRMLINERTQMKSLEISYQEIFDLLHKACTSISPDALHLLKQSAEKETSEEAKTFLQTMLKNVELSAQTDKPLCQSPGYPTVWIRWGEALQPNFGQLMGDITKAVREATLAGYIRPLSFTR